MIAMRGGRYLVLAVVLAIATAMLLLADRPRNMAKEYYGKIHDEKPKPKPKGPPHPKYLPEPTWTPPPVVDPFPSLSTLSEPPSIPAWNVPSEDLHTKYGMDYKPPLFIGFTRSWPILLQAVVSYITAGWPADQIFVIENTGVQWANAEGKLTLQNPFYLNHEQLKKLGVSIIQTPVLLNFAQLQNFYMHLSYKHKYPYYFWSHMDVLAMSYEGGKKDMTTPMGTDGYKTLYEMCLMDLNKTIHGNDKWAAHFYSYDHLTLVNREAYDDVGGWDTFIPYYVTDCDMHSRLGMKGWKISDARAGQIFDVNTALTDLRSLYRDQTVVLNFTDPSPPRPKEDDKKDSDKGKREEKTESDDLKFFHSLRDKADEMARYKNRRDRNTWQVGQKGGEGEPYYYPARGIAVAIDALTEAGKAIYRKKWGHEDCSLVKGGGLKFDDQWRVEKDY